MTLNGVMALMLCYFTEFASFRGPKVVEDVVVKKVHIRYLIFSWVSCSVQWEPESSYHR